MNEPFRAVLNWARSPGGRGSLFVASLLESTVLPVPLELALVPMMAADRRRIFWLATIALAGGIAGAAVGYLVGLALFDAVGRPLLDLLGEATAFEEAKRTFERGGFWMILGIGITPVPFQVATLAAGAAGYDPVMFLLATTLARGARYYGLGALVALFGERVLGLIERTDRRILLAIAVVAIAILGAFLWP